MKKEKKVNKKYNNDKYISKKSVYTKEELEKIDKISLRRVLIGAALMVPMLTIGWIEYFFPGINGETIQILRRFFLSLLVLGIVLIYMSQKFHIKKEIEDIKLKKVNYKFNTKDQFYRYIPAPFVQIAMLIMSMNIMRFAQTMMIKGSSVLGFVIVSLSIIVLYTIWMIYCNAFSTKKGKRKYIVVFLLWLLISISLFIAAY